MSPTRKKYALQDDRVALTKLTRRRLPWKSENPTKQSLGQKSININKGKRSQNLHPTSYSRRANHFPSAHHLKKYKIRDDKKVNDLQEK
jgi:hypothetical protein